MNQLRIPTLSEVDFFNRDPQVVAEDLIDRELWSGNHRVVVTAALPQARRDNATWIDRRPLFTDPDVSAYVAPYRASNLLFVRTEPGTCVRIDGVTTRSGEELTRPGQVTRELGLTSERLGFAALQGEIVTLQWQRKQS